MPAAPASGSVSSQCSRDTLMRETSNHKPVIVSQYENLIRGTGYYNGIACIKNYHLVTNCS